MKKEEKQMKWNQIMRIGKVVLLEYVLTALFLLLVTVLLYRVGLSEKTTLLCVRVIYVLVNLIGGLLIGKAAGSRKFLWGAITGISYFIVIFGVSVLIHKGVFVEAQITVITFLLCLAGGLVGGMLS